MSSIDASQVLAGAVFMTVAMREFLRKQGGDSKGFTFNDEQARLCGGDPIDGQPTNVSGYKWLVNVKRQAIELLKDDKPVTKKAKRDALALINELCDGYDDTDDEDVDGLDTVHLPKEESSSEEDDGAAVAPVPAKEAAGLLAEAAAKIDAGVSDSDDSSYEEEEDEEEDEEEEEDDEDDEEEEEEDDEEDDEEEVEDNAEDKAEDKVHEVVAQVTLPAVSHADSDSDDNDDIISKLS